MATVAAKFELGGFTSGRREGPETLFLSMRPRNLCRGGHAPKTLGAAALRAGTGGEPVRDGLETVAQPPGCTSTMSCAKIISSLPTRWGSLGDDRYRAN